MKRAHGEGTFHQLPNGSYQYRILVDGRRVAGYGKTKAIAKSKAMERARLVGDVKAGTTVNALVDLWCEQPPSSVGLKCTTRDNYVSLLRTNVVPVIGTSRVDAVTKRVAADTVRGFTGAESTRRSAYAAFVKVMDYAVSQGWVGVNVVREVPRPTRAESKRRDVTAAQARAVLAKSAGHRLEAAAWLAFGCGLRRGEWLALRWADVDLKAGTLSVTGNLTRSSQGLVRGSTKTKRGVRLVPLPRPVAEALTAHRRRQAADRLKAGAAWQDTDYVFTNEIGNPVEPRAMSRAWRGWAKKAGLKDTGTHTGRHFAATELLSSGKASVADVADQLGHDPSVLLATYAKPMAEGQRRAADALGDALRVTP